MQISTLAKGCLVDLGRHDASPKTLDEYERIYKAFVTYVTGTAGLTDDVRHFTGDVGHAFMRHLLEIGQKGSTVRQKMSALSTLAKYARTVKDARGRPLLADNPLTTFRWPRRSRPRQEFLYPDELRAFLAVERRWPAEAIARDLLVDTGLRVSELVRANVDDFVRMPTGWALYVTVKGEGRRDERVPNPVSTPVAEALAAYLRTRPVPFRRKGEAEPLLANTLGERYRRLALGDVVRRIGRAAGITRVTVSPHKLRRTANVVARFAELDSLTRSKLLNHLDPATIRAYDAVIPGELAQAREKTRLVGLARYLGVIGSEDCVPKDATAS